MEQIRSWWEHFAWRGETLHRDEGNGEGLNDPRRSGALEPGGHHERTTSLQTKEEDEVYPMNRASRGVCVIINQKKFDPHLGLDVRHGTDVDAENLEKVFESLSFEVSVKNNLNEKQLSQEIEHWSEFDHSDCDAFVFCLLTHGERDLIYATDGKMSTETLLEPFTHDRCRSLRGKPKLFFIQACRGDYLDKGSPIRVQSDLGSGDVYRLPADPDFLIAYSTVAGFYSWRNAKEGSWFMQSLCRVLADRNLVDNNDILSLLTVVNRNVAYKFESRLPDRENFDKCKQIPCVAFTLTKRLYMTPEIIGTLV